MSTLRLASILIVEDNPGDLLLLEDMLGDIFGSDIAVNNVRTLGEARQVLEDKRDFLILLDLSLPDSTGENTYQKIRLIAPDVPVVILSGLLDENTALSLVRKGAQDYLVKGQFDRNLLEKVLRYSWERQHIEKELVKSKIWWESIIQAIPDAVVITDSRERIVFANRAAQNLWKIPPDRFFLLSLGDLYREKPRFAGRQDSSTGNELALSCNVKTSEGKVLPAEVFYSRFILDSEELLITVVRDVTIRKKLERQLLQNQKMEAVGQLTAGIAHDFNNLLGIIVGNLDLMRCRVEKDEDLLHRTDVAINAAMRGADLTKRLLGFSRATDLNPSRISITDLLEEFLEIAVRTVGPDISIETDMDPRLPDIFADAAELETVLINLTVNARDAMPRGGKLLFSGKTVSFGPDDHVVQSREVCADDYVVLSVTDTGEGMPQSIMDSVFEPFFTTKESGKGTGLGLSMVYGFARQSGGTVRLISEEGMGTTVSILLPVIDISPVETVIPTEKEFSPASGMTVLLVDDESELLDVALNYLRNMGYTVTTAKNGPEALALLGKERHFSVLVTDVLMPGGMDGSYLAHLAREIDPRIKVIFTSGYPTQAFKDKKVLLDSIVVRKPYVASDLAAALQKVLPG